MPVVKDELFYHIQRGRRCWGIGERYFFGEGPNDWTVGFNTRWFGYFAPEEKMRYPVNFILEYVLGRRDGKGQVIPTLEGFRSDPHRVLHLAYEALSHYLRLVRELIFEQVRSVHFPELPSRMRCIWLIPRDQQAIRVWWRLLPGENRRILEVAATGKYHRTSQKPLELGTVSLEELRQRAFRYWAGVSSLESPSSDDEIIFEGFVEVKAILDPAQFGLSE